MPGPYVTNDARNYVGFGHQTVKGTGVAPTHFLAYLSGTELDHGQDTRDHYEGGNGPFMSFTEKLKHDPSVKAAAYARPDIGAFMSAHLLGIDTVSGAGPYDHVLTVDQVNDFLTGEVNLADEIIDRVTDVVVQEIKYSGKAGDQNALMMEIPSLGITVARQATAATEAYETDRCFLWDDCVFTVDAVADANVSEFSITDRLVLDENVRTGGVKRAHLPKLRLETEITLVQVLMGDGPYRLGNYGSLTGTAVQSTVSEGAFIVDANYGAGAAARQMKHEFLDVNWKTTKYTAHNPEGETVYLSRTGAAKRNFGAVNPLVRQTWKTARSTSYLV